MCKIMEELIEKIAFFVDDDGNLMIGLIWLPNWQR